MVVGGACCDRGVAARMPVGGACCGRSVVAVGVQVWEEMPCNVQCIIIHCSG